MIPVAGEPVFHVYVPFPRTAAVQFAMSVPQTAVVAMTFFRPAPATLTATFPAVAVSSKPNAATTAIQTA